MTLQSWLRQFARIQKDGLSVKPEPGVGQQAKTWAAEIGALDGFDNEQTGHATPSSMTRMKTRHPALPPVQTAYSRCSNLWRLCVLALSLTLAGATASHAQDAERLKASHISLRASFASSPFQRPLLLHSTETPGGLHGDVYAEINLPFALVGPALRTADLWCDILMLHLNVKQCSTAPPGGGTRLDLIVGGKHDQLLADAYRLAFNFKAVKATSDYLQITLDAEQGPMGTSQYRILVEVVALGTGASFLHLSYSYAANVLARVAMQGYLATTGRQKIGFSVVGRKPDGQTQFIGGARGVLERNTMRYFLAIEAYLDTLSLPTAQRFEARLEHWFAGTERHAMQLHEIDHGEYLSLKRGQARIQATPG